MTEQVPSHPTFIPSWKDGGECALAEEPWLRFIHDCYIGPQNSVDDVYSYMGTPEKPYPSRVDTAYPTIKTVVKGLTNMSSKFKYTATLTNVPPEYKDREMINCENAEERPAFGITNIRIRCLNDPTFSEKDIDILSLEVGGSWFDKAYGCAMGTCSRVDTEDGSNPTFSANLWVVQEGRVLPFTLYHQVSIGIDLLDSSQEKQLEVLYDVVKIKDVNTAQLNKGFDIPTCAWQFTGTEDFIPRVDSAEVKKHTGRYRIRSNFNHPLLDIHLRTEYPIQAARLVINQYQEIPFTYNDTTDVWSIVFTPFQGGAFGNLKTSLNASRIDSLTIEMVSGDGQGPGKVNHWARTLHPAHIMKGMMGLNWSK